MNVQLGTHYYNTIKVKCLELHLVDDFSVFIRGKAFAVTIREHFVTNPRDGENDNDDDDKNEGTRKTHHETDERSHSHVGNCYK